MSCPGDPPKRFVLQRTLRALFCLAGLVCIFCLQSPATADHARAPATEAAALLSTAATDVSQAEDFGVALEDSLEMVRVDLQEQAVLNYQAGSASKASLRNASSTRPELSPPLLV